MVYMQYGLDVDGLFYLSTEIQLIRSIFLCPLCCCRLSICSFYGHAGKDDGDAAVGMKLLRCRK